VNKKELGERDVIFTKGGIIVRGKMVTRGKAIVDGNLRC